MHGHSNIKFKKNSLWSILIHHFISQVMNGKQTCLSVIAQEQDLCLSDQN